VKGRSDEAPSPLRGRALSRGTLYADPHGSQPGRINHDDGGRGLYWIDPSGHGMDIITRPYGSGDSS
jgi:hypothetical protein